MVAGGAVGSGFDWTLYEYFMGSLIILCVIHDLQYECYLVYGRRENGFLNRFLRVSTTVGAVV